MVSRLKDGKFHENFPKESSIQVLPYSYSVFRTFSAQGGRKGRLLIFPQLRLIRILFFVRSLNEFRLLAKQFISNGKFY